MLNRAVVLHDQPAHFSVVLVQHPHHFLWIGRFGEGGEAAQIEKHHGDLAPVTFQQIFGGAI